MSDDWIQVGTVEVLRLRIYPIDPFSKLRTVCTEVVVEPGTFPVYRKYDAFRWIMRGRINERNEKIGDGLFNMHSGDVPTGLEVQFPSPAYGPEQFAEFLADSLCQPGPDQRLRFDVNLTEAT